MNIDQRAKLFIVVAPAVGNVLWYLSSKLHLEALP